MDDFFRAFFNEVRIVYRSKTGIFLTVVIPIAAMIIIGLIFPNITNMQNYKIAVYNADNGVYSNLALSLVYGMIKGETLVRVGDEGKMNAGLNSGLYDGALVVPKGFSKSIQEGKKFHLVFVPSTVNIQTSVIIYDTFKTLFSEIGNAVVVRNILELYRNPKNRVEIIPPDLVIAGPYNKKMNYVNFMVPGLSILIAIASVAITLSTSISYERENGILKGVLISTVNRPSHLLGKITAHTIDGTLKGIIALVSAQVFFHSGFETPFRSIFMLFIGALSFVGIGMMISILSSTQRLSNVLIIGYILPSIFLSGLFIPLHQMPKIAQLISKAFPITFAADAMQRISVLNYSISNVFSNDVLPLLLYSVIFISLSMILFSNLERIEEVS